MSSSNTSRPNRPNRSRRSSSTASNFQRNSRSSTTLSKTEVIINVYDLLSSGAVSSVLWPLGLSLLHTGVVLNNREYAYGATSTGAYSSGIFWTRPRLEPLGARFRCSILQGFTYLTPKEIEKALVDASKEFPGNEYNLLINNCNNFTDHLCRQLTAQPAPPWLNRASTFGGYFPCIVPRGWIKPPAADNDVDNDANEWSEEAEDNFHEGSSMLRSFRQGRGSVDLERNTHRVQGGGEPRDTKGLALPASEVAPSESLI